VTDKISLSARRTQAASASRDRTEAAGVLEGGLLGTWGFFSTATQAISIRLVEEFQRGAAGFLPSTFKESPTRRDQSRRLSLCSKSTVGKSFSTTQITLRLIQKIYVSEFHRLKRFLTWFKDSVSASPLW